MIKVKLYPFKALDKSLRAEMTAMRDGQSAYENPFFDLDFADILSRLRDDTHVAVAHDDHGLLGFWALHVRPDRWARPIGGPFSDWHGPVMRDGTLELPAGDFLKKAGLKGMTAHSLQPASFAACTMCEVSAAGVAHLPEGAAAYLEIMKVLHPKHAKNLRRAERLIKRDFGGPVFDIDNTSIEDFNWVMETKQTQYVRTGKHDVLGTDWARSMMEILRTEKFRRLRGRLSTLRFGNRLVAGEFNILSDTVMNGWITVYDTDYAKYSPGHMLMREVICDMENTGQVMCELGAGDNAYRKYYESYQRPVQNIVINAPGTLRPLAAGWRLAERAGPAKISGVMARMRRRGDQIFASELTTGARLRGLKDALKGPTKPR